MSTTKINAGSAFLVAAATLAVVQLRQTTQQEQILEEDLRAAPATEKMLKDNSYDVTISGHSNLFTAKASLTSTNTSGRICTTTLTQDSRLFRREQEQGSINISNLCSPTVPI